MDSKGAVQLLENYAISFDDHSENNNTSNISREAKFSDGYVSRSDHAMEIARVAAELTRSFQTQLILQKQWAQRMARTAERIAQEGRRTHQRAAEMASPTQVISHDCLPTDVYDAPTAAVHVFPKKKKVRRIPQKHHKKDSMEVKLTQEEIVDTARDDWREPLYRAREQVVAHSQAGASPTGKLGLGPANTSIFAYPRVPTYLEPLPSVTYATREALPVVVPQSQQRISDVDTDTAAEDVWATDSVCDSERVNSRILSATLMPPHTFSSSKVSGNIRSEEVDSDLYLPRGAPRPDEVEFKPEEVGASGGYQHIEPSLYVAEVVLEANVPLETKMFVGATEFSPPSAEHGVKRLAVAVTEPTLLPSTAHSFPSGVKASDPKTKQVDSHAAFRQNPVLHVDQAIEVTYSPDPNVQRAQQERDRALDTARKSISELENKLRRLHDIEGTLRAVRALPHEWRTQIADRQCRLNKLLIEKTAIKKLLKDISTGIARAHKGGAVPERVVSTAFRRQEATASAVQQMRATVLESFQVPISDVGKTIAPHLAVISHRTAGESLLQASLGVTDSNPEGNAPGIVDKTVTSPKLSDNTAHQPGNSGSAVLRPKLPSKASRDDLPLRADPRSPKGGARAARPLEGVSLTAAADASAIVPIVNLPGGELPQEERVTHALRSALVVSDSVKRKIVAALERYRKIGRGIIATNAKEEQGTDGRSLASWSSLNTDDEAVRLAIVRECEGELSDLIRKKDTIKGDLSSAERLLFQLQEQVDMIQSRDASVSQTVAEEYASLLDNDDGHNGAQENNNASYFSMLDEDGFLEIRNTFAFGHEKATGSTQCDLITGDEPRPTSATVTRFERVFKNEKALIDSVKSLAVSVAHSLHLHWALQTEATCKACLKPFTDPRTMWPCGHTLCEGCIERISSSVSEDILRCAECGGLCEGEPTPHVALQGIATHQRDLPFSVDEHPYEIGVYNAILEVLALTGDSKGPSLW